MTLSWLQIFRLGLVQAALGAIVVLMTSTLNRLMVVELGLPVVLPGALVALHYGVALGGVGATLAIPLLESNLALGLAVSVVAYAVIGLGVGASGTSLLALLATATAERRRPAAATITWLMMIAGRSRPSRPASFWTPTAMRGCWWSSLSSVQGPWR